MTSQDTTLADTMEGRLTLVRGRMSQEKFAARIGRSMRTVARWETDFRGRDADLRDVAERIGVRFEWLKTGDGSMRAKPVPATGQVSEDPSPVDQPSSEDLQETGRMTYLQLIGPGGRVMLEVEMVIKATTKPHQIALDVKEGIG